MSRQPGSGCPVTAAVANLAARFGVSPGARHLVGVSGGRDSMVLLHALVRVGYQRLLVCHLDHGIRGRAARADARFVEKSAAEFGLESEVRRADVRGLAKTRKLSLETAAREARKEFFFDVARSRRCRTLLLAHHADDQVETVLFNLCRGTGTAGLAGMLSLTEWRAVSIGPRRPAPLRVVRPLLEVWRRQIDEYADAHGVEYREDASNTDPAHTRNRVRHEIVPALNEVLGRDASRNIWRAAEIVGADEALLREYLGTRERSAAATARLPWKALSAVSVAEQRRVLRAWLRGRGCPGVGFEEVERTRQLLDLTSNGPAKVNLPSGLCARRQAGLLFVEAANANAGGSPSFEQSTRRHRLPGSATATSAVKLGTHEKASRR